MSTTNNELLQAVDLARNGDWDAAHRLVQNHEGDPTADWLHAVLHKIEGDTANSHYWYRRAHCVEHADDEPRAELEMIRTRLTAQSDSGAH